MKDEQKTLADAEAEVNAMLVTYRRQRDAAMANEVRAEVRAAVADARRETLAKALAAANEEIERLRSELGRVSIDSQRHGTADDTDRAFAVAGAMPLTVEVGPNNGIGGALRVVEGGA